MHDHGKLSWTIWTLYFNDVMKSVRKNSLFLGNIFFLACLVFIAKIVNCVIFALQRPSVDWVSNYYLSVLSIFYQGSGKAGVPGLHCGELLGADIFLHQYYLKREGTWAPTSLFLLSPSSAFFYPFINSLKISFSHAPK